MSPIRDAGTMTVCLPVRDIFTVLPPRRPHLYQSNTINHDQNHQHSGSEKHKDEKSAWTIVEGKVYDVTEFLEEHPGGKKILLKNCGKDSTELFHQYHTKKILKNVAGPMMIGQVTSEAKL
ncbi:hypothetical protein H4Q26_008733 [Puccinia striiformis f. sp. tritici PST-130]|nr:hypothetical protein H4Q26_008733 [Puccinia striiformis f. sp. tritici PST-130]